MNKISVLAYIPVRGGSKGIPGKNIKPIAGHPLIHWVEQACINAKKIDRVVIGTDSKEIAETAKQLESPKLEIFWRNPDNCQDTSSTEEAMLEFAGKDENFTHMVLVQATSPLLESKHLDEAIDKFFGNSADSLISLVRQLKFVWKENTDGTVHPVNYNPLSRPRRQEFKGILTEPGAFYITSRQKLLESKCRISGKTIGYELPEELYCDLDGLLEWEIVETILRKSRKINN